MSIPLSQKPVTTGYAITEGDDLYYEVRGDGPPLLLIAGGGGDAGFFSLVAPLLANEFKVITYDRRGNSRSSRCDLQNFTVSQQSRDAVAVLRAVGETSAFVCGNSGGAVIALDMAKTQPQAVRTVVAHEAPIIALLPDYQKWRRFFAGLYWLACTAGPNVAMWRFALALRIPWRALGNAPDDFGERNSKNQPFFFYHELLPFTEYRPDTKAIRQNGVKVIIAVGQYTLAKQLFYGRPAPLLAEALGCELAIFPGHHVAYFDMAEAWAATLRTLLKEGERG